VSLTRQLITVGAAALLASHVVWGCCVHHDCHAASTPSGDAEHGCSHDQNSSLDPPHPIEPPQEGECEEGSCSFLGATGSGGAQVLQQAPEACGSNRLQPHRTSVDATSAVGNRVRMHSRHVPLFLSKCVLVV
jgi:hypothetical protein